ncbi:MAG: DUF2240 family protein [Thermoplasmata archaeon]|nr:DUF2240 family protein [Thermoplasmata archaeon]
MLSDKKIALAFVFQRKGEKRVKILDVVLYLSVSLGWFDLNNARLFVDNAIKEGLLQKIDDIFVEPTFDYESIKIPVGFKPGIDTTVTTVEKDETKGEKLLEKICNELSAQTGEEKQKILEESMMLSSSLGVYPEIAVLILGKKRGVDVSRFINDVEREILDKC